MRNSKRLVYVILTFIILIAWADHLNATHEVDHRYTVFGSVRDESGRPVPDTRVIVTDTKIGEGSTTFSRKDGSYEVTLHLHNQSLGDEIVISARGEEKRIMASFDPSDKFTERRRKVDFGPEEGEPNKNRWVYYSIGFILLAGTLIYLGVFRKGSGKGSKGVIGQRGMKGKKR